ncbi:MAG: thioesterase family protein [Gemmatimonadaceae bacterium]
MRRHAAVPGARTFLSSLPRPNLTHTMNLYLRVLGRLLGWIRGTPRLGLFDLSVLRLRVWPNDLDLNGHMNNGRYLAVMDLGRIDLVARMGVLPIAARHGWRPVVAAATIRFRRPLTPFARYELRTRVVCWDEKWWFMGQDFICGEELAATALVRVLFRGPRGAVAPAELLAALQFSPTSPPEPAAVTAWRGADAALRDSRSPPAHVR